MARLLLIEANKKTPTIYLHTPAFIHDMVLQRDIKSLLRRLHCTSKDLSDYLITAGLSLEILQKSSRAALANVLKADYYRPLIHQLNNKSVEDFGTLSLAVFHRKLFLFKQELLINAYSLEEANQYTHLYALIFLKTDQKNLDEFLSYYLYNKNPLTIDQLISMSPRDIKFYFEKVSLLHFYYVRQKALMIGYKSIHDRLSLNSVLVETAVKPLKHVEPDRREQTETFGSSLAIESLSCFADKQDESFYFTDENQAMDEFNEYGDGFTLSSL